MIVSEPMELVRQPLPSSVAIALRIGNYALLSDAEILDAERLGSPAPNSACSRVRKRFVSALQSREWLGSHDPINFLGSPRPRHRPRPLGRVDVLGGWNQAPGRSQRGFLSTAPLLSKFSAYVPTGSSSASAVGAANSRPLTCLDRSVIADRLQF